MALTENGMDTTMLVSPTTGNLGGYPTMIPYLPYGQQNNGGGMFGGDSWLGILFLIALCNGGFGGGFGGFGGNNQLGYDFPWLLNGQNGINNNVSDGFRDQMLNNNITSIRDGVQGLSTQLCNCCADMRVDSLNGFNGVSNSIFGAQSAISQQLNTNEIANLNRSFAEQAANMQGFNGLQSQLAQCCCDNRAATADLKYTVATEACADRAAVGDALQNVTMQNMGNTNVLVSAIRDGIQSIKDELCADRLDAERRENQNLRTQLNMATLAASQVAQTADMRASQITANNNLLTELRNCPIPAQAVYGNQPVFTCPQNNGCGCGCGCNGGSF